MDLTDRGLIPPQVLDPARLEAVRATGLLDTGAEEAFDRLATLAATLLETPLAFVTIVDESRSFWKACIGVDATAPEDRQNTVQESFCQYVIGSEQPLIVDDAAADPRTRDNPSIVSMGVASWAGFPVHSPEGQVLGTFCVVDTRIRQWTERDVHVLETLSKAASGEIALRAALDEAHAASLDALAYGEANAELALTLQESLLPPRLPEVPGLDVAARYRSSDDVARVTGDFYDVFHTRASSWGVVVGDVCGHGAPAAALTALARYTVRSLATREPSPSGVLRGLNTAIRERETDDDRFLTAAYLAVRPTRSGSFKGRLALAGHPAALRRSADGAVVEVGVPGTLLGPVGDPDLRDHRVELSPGDLLLLYTDGVTEARPARGEEEFGEKRLHELLGSLPRNADAATVARAVESAALEHTGGRALDDMAVVVLRVPETP